MNKKHNTDSTVISITLPEIVLFPGDCSSSFLLRVSKSSFVISVEQKGNVFKKS